MRIASRESTAIFVQSFKKLLRNTSTVAIPSVALRGFDAEIAGVSFYCIFQSSRPPPSQIFQKELLMAAEERGEYF